MCCGKTRLEFRIKKLKSHCITGFFFIPDYNKLGPVTPDERGQRPSVIFRGVGMGAKTGGVNSVYLVYFARVIFSGGAVQYVTL